MTNLKPGEMFVPSDETLLIDQANSFLAILEAFDAEQPARYGVVLELNGRRNHTQERISVTVVLSPRDAYELTHTIMSNLENMIRHKNRESTEK